MSAGATAPTAPGWDDLARRAARGAGEAVEPEALCQLVCFLAAGTPYAVAVESVREIVRIGPMTPIPRAAREVRGVISLRGEIIEVIDLRLRLGLPPTEIDKAARIVVVNDQEGRVAGLLVDAVKEVLRIPETAIGDAAGDSQGLVTGLHAQGERFVSLLDLERVLEVDDA